MEANLLKTLELFTKHAQALEAKKPGCTPTFELSVRKSSYKEGVTVKLTCRFDSNSGNYETVEAASFNALIDEVWRRLGFSDRQLLEVDRIQASLLQLESPKEDLINNDIPF